MLRSAGVSRNCAGLLNHPAWVSTRALASSRPYAKTEHREVDSYKKQDSETQRLPRYLRRATVSQGTSNLTEVQSSTSTKPKYRSRHYDPSKEGEKKDGQIKLLEPYVLSARLKKLCDAGKVDDAVVMLKEAPLDASNTAVWNSLIWEAMKVRKFKLAYILYVDMKRRGFSPTTRTFQTMFSGLSRILQWTHHPQQLENAQRLYEHFQRHIESLKKHESDSPDITSTPLVGYIKLLGDAERYQDVFDVYYALDSSGPYSANQFIYSAMFSALATPGNERGPKAFGEVKLLWSQMLSVSKKTRGFPIDAALVTAAIGAISRTAATQTDFTFAFQLIREYFGLTIPEEAPSISGTVPLNAQALANIFILCHQSGHPEYAVHYFEQLKRRPPAMGDTSLLDQKHMGDILRSYLAISPPDLGQKCLETLEFMFRREITGVNGGEKNGPKIRPSVATYQLVMLGCWNSADWESSRKAFQLMTGYHLDDFGDKAVERTDWKPRIEKRAAGKNLHPTAETISVLLRCANASLTAKGKRSGHTKGNLERIRQCLRLIDYLGGVKAIAGRRLGPPSEDRGQMLRNQAFYASKLSIAVKEAIQLLVGSEGSKDRSSRAAEGMDEMTLWRSLNEEARSISKMYEQAKPPQPTDFIPTTSEVPVFKRTHRPPRTPPSTSWKRSLKMDQDKIERI